jgi:hypothetical protein
LQGLWQEEQSKEQRSVPVTAGLHCKGAGQLLNRYLQAREKQLLFQQDNYSKKLFS